MLVYISRWKRDDTKYQNKNIDMMNKLC